MHIFLFDVNPRGIAWIGYVNKANDVHPLMECSNMGRCDRRNGVCNCYANYEGLACERIICPNDCSNAGVCLTQNQLADEAGRVYSSVWDSNKQVGCVCDIGRRGLDCSQIECPSGPGMLLFQLYYWFMHNLIKVLFQIP